MSMGIRLETPRKYIENFTSLDYMKTLFLQKKQQEQMQ
jgi:serine/threonine protein kinase